MSLEFADQLSGECVEDPDLFVIRPRHHQLIVRGKCHAVHLQAVALHSDTFHEQNHVSLLLDYRYTDWLFVLSVFRALGCLRTLQTESYMQVCIFPCIFLGGTVAPKLRTSKKPEKFVLFVRTSFV